MKNTLIEVGGSIPALIKNTHLTVNLQGWPAAVAVIALCTGGVAIYAIQASASQSTSTEGASSSVLQKTAA